MGGRAAITDKAGHCTWTSTKECKGTDWTERGCYNLKMKLEVVLKEIASHPDFMNEKTQLEHHINSCGYAFFFSSWSTICELNPIEHCWSQAKCHTRAYCNYRITGLRKIFQGHLPKKTLKTTFDAFETMYMYEYLLGYQTGIQLEEQKLLQVI